MNQFWSGNECERTHTLTTTTTGSKCSQKEVNNQTDYQSHNALGPPKVSVYFLLTLREPLMIYPDTFIHWVFYFCLDFLLGYFSVFFLNGATHMRELFHLTLFHNI